MAFLKNLCEIGIALDFQWYRTWVITWACIGAVVVTKYFKQIMQNYIAVIVTGTVVLFFIPLVDIWLRSGMNGPVTMLGMQTLVQPLICVAVLGTSIVASRHWFQQRKLAKIDKGGSTTTKKNGQKDSAIDISGETASISGSSVISGGSRDSRTSRDSRASRDSKASGSSESSSSFSNSKNTKPI